MNPIAVIFDFDGVIVDSFEMHKNAWISAFEETFVTKFPQMDPESLTGKSSLQIAISICDEAGVDADVNAFLHLKTSKVVDGSRRPELLAGVKEIIQVLKSMGIPYAVASNAPLEYLESVLNYYEISVPIVLGFEQVTNPKPAPDLFLLAAKKMGVTEAEFSNTFVFEDSAPGLTAAKSAGMKPVGIRARFSDEEMINAGATEIFDSLKDVINSGLIKN